MGALKINIGTEAEPQWIVVGGPGPTGADGADGADGAPGVDGVDGESAYQVAVRNGFVGTEAQWLDSLEGPQGPPGADGQDGADGADGSVYSRSSFVRTTASLAAGAIEQITVSDIGSAARLLSVETDVPARVRIYAASADATADEARPIGTDPTGDHGLMLEYVTTATQLAGRLSPLVDWWNSDGDTDLFMAVTNLTNAASAVTATISCLRTE